MSVEKDAIIIGAGASGLSAAKELTRLGLTYTVIEGSHRIGGRAYSEEVAPGVWFDLGCTILEGAQDTFLPIANQLGFKVGDHNHFDESLIKYYRNGAPLDDAQQAECMQFGDDSYNAIVEASKSGQDIAVSDIIDLEHEFIAPILTNISSVWTRDADEVSCADVADAKGGCSVPVQKGYGNLVAAWGADVPVSLNTRADRIDWSGRGVSVETPKGSIKGRTALITVSTGILGAGDILFTPGLPDWKMDAIHGVPIGTENKMCIYFDEDIFGPDGRGVYSVWNDDGNGTDDSAFIEASVMGHNYCAVEHGGRQAVWLEKQGQQAGHDFAVDRISEVFGNDIRKHVSRSIVTAWTTEPWTRGAYAAAKPGQFHQRANLAKNVDERLFFAGEATVYEAQGTCHGAYVSGIRAAQEIAAQ
ncbi:MAG: FAD-dependent oxidoreductase, partial [Rhodospirillales bacterium]|nr:FAD-dependent oxidoreductase [Rhodospirillales bacterium]